MERVYAWQLHADQAFLQHIAVSKITLFEKSHQYAVTASTLTNLHLLKRIATVKFLLSVPG